jgi:hypothetical protein
LTNPRIVLKSVSDQSDRNQPEIEKKAGSQPLKGGEPDLAEQVRLVTGQPLSFILQQFGLQANPM